MDNGAVKLTEREMIKQVVLKGIPVVWSLDLKRANNHNCATLSELQAVLKPIEEADESEREYKEKKKGTRPKKEGYIKDGLKSGDKPCRKPGHNHKWKDCPDNRFGKNYRSNETNNNEINERDSSREREIRCEDENESNVIELNDDSSYEDDDKYEDDYETAERQIQKIILL